MPDNVLGLYVADDLNYIKILADGQKCGAWAIPNFDGFLGAELLNIGGQWEEENTDHFSLKTR